MRLTDGTMRSTANGRLCGLRSWALFIFSFDVDNPFVAWKRVRGRTQSKKKRIT